MLTRFSARALAVSALLVAVFALAACGGGEDEAMSKDEYRSQAQKISDKAEADFEGAIKNATSEDPEESLAGINQMKSISAEVATKLDTLDPPEEFKAVHGKFIGSLRALERRGDAVDKAAKGDDPNAISSAVESFQESLRELDTVGDEYDKVVGTT